MGAILPHVRGGRCRNDAPLVAPTDLGQDDRMTTAGTGTHTVRPRHVGVVMDGNCRWARLAGFVNPSEGHRRGADHVEDLLGWCEARGIDHVSIYVLSAANIRKRSGQEVEFLFGLVTRVLPGLVERSGHWSLHVSGDLTLLPDDAAAELTWQAAHAEVHVSPKLWPDFDEAYFDDALAQYATAAG